MLSIEFANEGGVVSVGGYLFFQKGGQRGLIFFGADGKNLWWSITSFWGELKIPHLFPPFGKNIDRWAHDQGWGEGPPNPPFGG